MAEIREELTLIDKFTNVFNNFISFGNKAVEQSAAVQQATNSMNKTYEAAIPVTEKLTVSTDDSVNAYEKQMQVIDNVAGNFSNLENQILLTDKTARILTESTNDSVMAYEEQIKSINNTIINFEALDEQISLANKATRTLVVSTDDSVNAYEEQIAAVYSTSKSFNDLENQILLTDKTARILTESTNDSVTAYEEQIKAVDNAAGSIEILDEQIFLADEATRVLTDSAKAAAGAQLELAVTTEELSAKTEELTEKAMAAGLSIDNMNNSSMRAASMVSGIAAQALAGNSAIAKMGIGALNTASSLVKLTGDTKAAQMAMLGATVAFAAAFALINTQNPVLKTFGVIIGGVAAALAAFTLTSKLAAIGVIPLNAALWANPLIIIGAAVAAIILGAAYALGVFGSESQETASDIDEMNAAMAEMSAGVSNMEQEIAASNKAMEQGETMAKRYADSMNRIKQSFGEWDMNASYAKIYNDRLNDLLSTQNKTADQFNEMNYIVGQLNSMMPGLNLGIDNATGALYRENDEIRTQIDNINELIGSYIKLAQAKAQSEVLGKMMTESMETQLRIEREYGSIENLQAQATQADLTKDVNIVSELQRLKLFDDSLSGALDAFNYIKTGEGLQGEWAQALGEGLITKYTREMETEFAPIFDALSTYEAAGEDMNWIIERMAQYFEEETKANQELLDEKIIIPGFENRKIDVGTVDSIKNEVRLAEEDLKMFVDRAERDYVVQVNQLSPSISVDVTNENGENLDANTIADSIKIILEEQIATHTNAAYAY